MKPSDYFAWSRLDQGLAEGLIHMEQTTGAHGMPLELALDPDMDGWFEVDDTTIDHAQAAIDRWQNDRKGKDHEPGVRLAVVNTKPTG